MPGGFEEGLRLERFDQGQIGVPAGLREAAHHGDARLQAARKCGDHDRRHRAAAPHSEGTVQTATSRRSRSNCTCSLERGASGLNSARQSKNVCSCWLFAPEPCRSQLFHSRKWSPFHLEAPLSTEKLDTVPDGDPVPVPAPVLRAPKFRDGY